MNDLFLYKLPPQSIEAEESLLSACIIDPESLISAIEILQPEYFYRNTHQKIFKAIKSLYTKKEPVTLVTLTNILKQTDELSEVGGATYLAKLVGEIPMAVNVKHYANIIRGKAALRQTIEKCNKIIKQCFEDSTDVIQIIDNAQKEILSIEVEDPNSKKYSTMPEILEKGMEVLEERYKNPGKITGLRTGFSRFDFLTWGLQPSDLVLIAARPSTGKTAMALNIARNAVSENIPTAIFSLEMSEQQLLFRLMSDMSKVNGQKFKSGLLKRDDWEAITNSAGAINGFPLYIDDSGGLSIKQIQRRIRNIYKKQ
jgi:replicative DNA helicase